MIQGNISQFSFSLGNINVLFICHVFHCLIKCINYVFVIFQNISYFFFKYNSLRGFCLLFFFNSIFYYRCVISLKRRLAVKCLTYNYKKERRKYLIYCLKISIENCSEGLYCKMHYLYKFVQIVHKFSHHKHFLFKLYYVPKSCIRNL